MVVYYLVNGFKAIKKFVPFFSLQNLYELRENELEIKQVSKDNNSFCAYQIQM